jgi:hypothetical protein
MTRDEWLRRYREYYRQQRPDLTARQLDDLVDIEAFDGLSGEFPDDPEAAAERVILDWDQEDRVRPEDRLRQ